VHNGQANLRHRRNVNVISELERLLAILTLEVIVEGIRTGTHSESWRREFQIVGAAMLEVEQLLAPNELRTNRMESRMVFDNLRE